MQTAKELMRDTKLSMPRQRHLEMTSVSPSRPLIKDETGTATVSPFHNLLETASHYDVILRVGCHAHKAHKLVLAANSSVFESVFHSDLIFS